MRTPSPESCRVSARARALALHRTFGSAIARERASVYDIACHLILDLDDGGVDAIAVDTARRVALLSASKNPTDSEISLARAGILRIVHHLDEADGGFRADRTFAHPVSNTFHKRSPVLKLLRLFSWFCSKENRRHIELVATDLKKDARQMREHGHDRFFIGTVLLWHAVFGTMLPILWDGGCRLLIAVLPITKVIAGIKGAWFK
jgi:hypothetical protein